MSESLVSKLIKYPTAFGRMVIVIVNNIYCIPTYVVWMTLLIPLKHLHPDAYYKIEGVLFHWLLAVVSMWSYSAGYDIVESGDDITECIDKRTLVIANHQSTADVPLLMANFNTKQYVLPNIMWIMDRLFKYTNFGIVSIIHQDFFIASGRDNRDESVNALKIHIKNSFIARNRKWMVLFPEGGFLRKRREVSQRFARKNGLPILQNVTLPRIGAMKAIMEVMGATVQVNNNCSNSNAQTASITSTPQKSSSTLSNGGTLTQRQYAGGEKQLKPSLLDNGKAVDNLSDVSSTISQESQTSDGLLEYILDVTIAYHNGIPLDLPNILHGLRDSCKTHVLYRLYKISEIPKDTEGLTKWLYDRFIEKNDLLENFYNNGKFYLNDDSSDGHETLQSTVIHQDILRFLLINLFFIASTYFHYQMFLTILSYVSNLTESTT